MLEKQQKRYRRRKKVRAKIFGTTKVPRLCVFRSSKHIYAQLIDDEKGKILAAASCQEIKKPKTKNKKLKTKTKEKEAKETQKPLAGKVAVAYEVGKLIAEKAHKKKIEKVVFDRGGYTYHGRVKAIAEGARGGGLKF